ncbi:MAG: patatin-like phospholipase family protein [Solirubrobacteraceae bacterium]
MTPKPADGVFSGGGVKAISYAGALTAAEEAGYGAWQDLAGTSAGAITAAALAVGYDAEALTERLMQFDLATVADIGWPRRLAQVRNLIRHHAIARGVTLHGWIEQLLEQAPRPAKVFGELSCRLHVVATDLVHHRMVVFPDDAPKYLAADGSPFTPEEFPIADAVRMSAGYPFMFAPWTLMDAVSGQAGALVDGGIVSGFPVFMFDSARPSRPTWGFRLDGEQPVGRPIRGYRWPLGMLLAVLETSIGVHDRIAAATFSQRTIVIPTGAVGTLQFTMSHAEKRELWEAGHRAASDFFASGPTGANIFGETPPAQDLPS